MEQFLEINQPADTNQTFEIFSLDDEKLSDDIKENIIFKKDKLLNDLKSFREVSKNSGAIIKLVKFRTYFQANKILKLSLATTPIQRSRIFSVAYWGGDFIDEKKNLDLVTYTEPQIKTMILK